MSSRISNASDVPHAKVVDRVKYGGPIAWWTRPFDLLSPCSLFEGLSQGLDDHEKSLPGLHECLRPGRP